MERTVIIIAIIIIIAMSKQLTILNLGETLAKGLGQKYHVDSWKFILNYDISGVAVSMVGQIAFVGLMVPHIVRFLVGTDYSKVLPLTALTGGLLMILADTVARMLGEAPVGDYFIYRRALLLILS